MTYDWQTFWAHFPGDGTTPLNQNTLKLYTIPEGSSIRRTLLHMQLSVQVESASAAGLPLDFAPTVVAATGLWLGDTTTPAVNSPSVLDDANTATWLLWDGLQERVDTDAIAATGIFRLTWETPRQGVDVQTRRDAIAGNSNDLWLGWQFFDGFGVINNSTDTYNAYLAGYYTIRMLINTP